MGGGLFMDEVPAHAIMVALKTSVVSDRIIDGIVASLTVVDINKFDKELKNAFIEIELIIKKCEKALTDNMIIEQERSLKNGCLQTTLIDHILERANDDGKLFKNTGGNRPNVPL